MGQREKYEVEGIIDPDVQDAKQTTDGFVTHCIAHALCPNRSGEWKITVNLTKPTNNIVRHGSYVSVSVCEVDMSNPENPIPIVKDAAPRIYNVACERDKVVICGSTDSATPLNLMLKMLIRNLKYDPFTLPVF
jgi:hypothetical protein